MSCWIRTLGFDTQLDKCLKAHVCNPRWKSTFAGNVRKGGGVPAGPPPHAALASLFKRSAERLHWVATSSCELKVELFLMNTLAENVKKKKKKV